MQKKANIINRSSINDNCAQRQLRGLKLRSIFKAFSFLALFDLGLAPATASDDDLRRFTFEVNPGVVWMQDVSYREPGVSGSFSVDPGPSLELAVGYNLNQSLLIELQSGLLLFAGSSSHLNQFEDYVSDDIYQVPIMARLLYKVPLHSRFRPFLGVGVGGVYTSVEENGEAGFFGGPTSTHSDFTFGYQACAGVRYQINRLLALGLEYNFMGTLEHSFNSLHFGETYSHTIAVSLSLQF
jgi:opacity protein-like surface antigen